tara:strand:- start:2044 stop:3339 length:1296 start_codon:yes stop_codon:yes gene_type:complete
MDIPQWFVLVGLLLLLMGLTAPAIKRIPVTSAIIYLAVGIILGPSVLGLFHINPIENAKALELLTEVAVLISLFAAGVKMPVPVSLERWQSPFRLAFLGMAVSVGLVAAFAHLALGLSLGAAVLLGAIIAPTDPVLATDVQVRHPGDRDHLRFTLTSEAGMNDGSAFPFVMLGLGLLGVHDLGRGGDDWILYDVFWATAAGLGIGVLGGYLLARLAAPHYQQAGKPGVLGDFLGLGLICVVYGTCLHLSAWGFLGVFAAAVTLRQTEHALVGATPEREFKLQSEILGDDTTEVGTRSLSEASLIFKEHLERLSEVLLILLIGGTLFLDSWSWRAVGLAFFLFFVARPLSVFISFLGTNTPWRIRCLSGWFGVRGIGSLYYLAYAIQQGIDDRVALQLTHFTLIIVTLSIIVHGMSVKPLIKRFWTERGVLA